MIYAKTIIMNLIIWKLSVNESLKQCMSGGGGEEVYLAFQGAHIPGRIDKSRRPVKAKRIDGKTST